MWAQHKKVGRRTTLWEHEPRPVSHGFPQPRRLDYRDGDGVGFFEDLAAPQWKRGPLGLLAYFVPLLPVVNVALTLVVRSLECLNNRKAGSRLANQGADDSKTLLRWKIASA